MEELTKEDLLRDKKNKVDHLTVGELKKFISEYNLSNDAIVMCERVEDVYFEKHGWKTYPKFGYETWLCTEHNKDIDSGKYLDKEQYPDLDPIEDADFFTKYTDEEIKESMDQYHPASMCAGCLPGEDILFIRHHI